MKQNADKIYKHIALYISLFDILYCVQEYNQAYDVAYEIYLVYNTIESEK